jgi:hypothetical protein
MNGQKLTLLRHEQPISLLQRHAMSRVLIIGRKPRRMRALCDFSTGNLLQRVDALAGGIEGVHEMHGILRCAADQDCDKVIRRCISISFNRWKSKCKHMIDLPDQILPGMRDGAFGFSRALEFRTGKLFGGLASNWGGGGAKPNMDRGVQHRLCHQISALRAAKIEETIK